MGQWRRLRSRDPSRPAVERRCSSAALPPCQHRFIPLWGWYHSKKNHGPTSREWPVALLRPAPVWQVAVLIRPRETVEVALRGHVSEAQLAFYPPTAPETDRASRWAGGT